MKKYYFFLLPVFAAIFSSCNKIDDSNLAPADPLQGLSLTDTLTMYTGNVVKLDVQITPASYDTTKLVWQSSDTSVIAVSDAGVINAKNEGTSKISLSNKAQTKSVSCLVTVKDSLKVGLLAYYPFNNSTNDLSGNNNNGTAVNITGVINRFGAANSAYYFNGINSYISVKDNQKLRLNGTNFTLNAWVKLDLYNASYGVNLLSKHISGADNGWAWGITGYSLSSQGIITYGPGGGSAFARGTTSVGLNQWHMVTTVYNVTYQRISIYVDGVFDTMADGQPSPNANTDPNLYIGRDNPEVPTNGYFVQGALDDIRIYKRALTLKEIKKLYNLTY